MKKLLIILLFASCTPKVVSYEIQGEMIQKPVVVEEKEHKPDKVGRAITVGTVVILYSLIFVR